MRKSRIVAASGAAALIVSMGAGPAFADNTENVSKSPAPASSPTNGHDSKSPQPTDKPSTTPTKTKTANPTPSTPPEKTFHVTVTPKHFRAGDTLHVKVTKCPSKPSVHSKILTGGAHWTHENGAWKTPVHVAKGLRVGYYKFTVTCKGYDAAVFKVRYGHPKGHGDDNGSHPSKPAKHTPNNQTKYVPNGGASTGGGSTAQAFV